MFLRLNRKNILRLNLIKGKVRAFQMLSHIPRLTLATAKCGQSFRISHICPDCPHCIRLRELGFHDRTLVRKIADGAAIICLVMGTRVALGRELCDHVEVEPVAS